MISKDLDPLTTLRSWMDELVDAAQPLNRRLSPATDSPLAAHRSQGLTEGAFDLLQFHAAVVLSYLRSAEHQLLATSRLLEEPVMDTAALTCLRASLESSARAWWLLAGDPTERVERTLAEGLASAKEFERLHVAMGSSGSSHPWRDEMLALAERQGLDSAKLPSSRASTTKILDALSSKLGVASWKIASAAGHSTIYAALARMTLDVLEQDDTLSQVTLPILNMAATALDAYAEAVAERARLHGWTQQLHEWDAVRTEVVGGIAFHVERILAHEESG